MTRVTHAVLVATLLTVPVLVERADQVGVGGVVTAAQERVRVTQEQLHSALAERDFGVPALQALKSAVLEWIKPPQKLSSPTPKPRPRALARLQLGPMQSALYVSDRVLDRATRLREGWIARLQTVAVVLGGIGLALLLARAQAGSGGGTQRD